MEIKYDAYYRTESGHIRIIHGTLTDEDLQDAVKRKEDRDSISHAQVSFERVSWDGVDF